MKLFRVYLIRFYLIIVAFLGLNGCYLSGSISTIDSPAISPTLNKAMSVQNVSGGNDYVLTQISGYRVKQAAGLLTNKQFVSTPQGFKVYLHVTGQLISEEYAK